MNQNTSQKVVKYTDTQICEYLPKSIVSLIEEFRTELMIEKEGAVRYVNYHMELERVPVRLLNLAEVKPNGQCLWNIVL